MLQRKDLNFLYCVRLNVTLPNPLYPNSCTEWLLLNALKAHAIRYSTLDDICRVIVYLPGDILEFISEEGYEKLRNFYGRLEFHYFEKF